MKKLKTFIAVVKIGSGTKDGGFYQTSVELEASNVKSARKKALKLALSGTDVTVELSPGNTSGINPVYMEAVGVNAEAW